jgi:diaminohydroxyphosphoribosylaminopyrimidine deaminase/5-amino-6-(5-phosphoribosylamino)uracil reductase
MASPAETAAMRRAIALSAAGLGTTSPNPPVGCVLLGADGRIVGEGYHERKGEPHAEANALAAAGRWLPGRPLWSRLSRATITGTRPRAGRA